MQWSAAPNAGFTDGAPWIMPPDHFKAINAAVELQDPDSILHYYKRLIRLRKERPVVAEGDIAFFCTERPELFAYRRTLGSEQIAVINNLTDETLEMGELPWTAAPVRVIGNYPGMELRNGHLVLRPYESVVLERSSAAV